MEGGEGAGEFRRGDRREEGSSESGGRRGVKRATSRLANILRSIGGVIVLVAVIVFTVRSMRPVYATRGTLGDELRKHAPGAASAIGAFDSTNVDRLMATTKFQNEKRNFYEDVMRLKQVDSARADSIAQFAVREAYIRGISPAIIFGVMLTENSRFISKAQSNVGAVGLMQVYPKVWLTKEMTALFGRDLATDSTNVKYGVFILSHYFNPKTKTGETTERDWATALLRYNGCVRGTNTPRCHTYPDKVQNFVENQATSICSGRSFYDCIAKPFIDGLFHKGKLAPDSVTRRLAGVTSGDSAGGVTIVAAGEVATAAPAPFTVPPVVVSRPDSGNVSPVTRTAVVTPPAIDPGTSAAPAVAAPAAAVSPPAKGSRKALAKATTKPAAKAATPASRSVARRSAPAKRSVVAARTAKPSRSVPKKATRTRTPARRQTPIPPPPKPIRITLP